MFTDSGDFGVYTATDPSRVDKSRSLIRRELDRITQSKISARELSQAKSQVKGAIMLGLESMSNRMMRIGREELIYKRHVTLDEVMEQTEAITADSILDSAQRIIGKADYSEVLFVPDDSIDTD
jgi:predicted Zn-dependent peptidase